MGRFGSPRVKSLKTAEGNCPGKEIMTQFSIDLASGPSVHRPSYLTPADKKPSGSAESGPARRSWPFLVKSGSDASTLRQGERYAPSAFAS